MIELITGLFGGQLGAIVAGVAGVLALWFGFSSKLKTNTIKKQEQVIINQEVDKVVILSALSTEKEASKRMQEANEILSTTDDRDVVIERMRERAAARSNSNKD